MPPEPTVPQLATEQPAARGMTAAHLVESVPQLDDSGANTADRYDWQAAMAAADGLALYLDGLGDDGRLRPDCQDKVLCEWQEDWILFSGESVELVSGKHRDSSAGAYTTVTKLAHEGGLAHLFNRWSALQGSPFCRLVTSGGLAGTGDPKELLAAVDFCRSLQSSGKAVAVNTEHAGIITHLRRAITNHDDATRQRWTGDGSSPATAEHERDAEVARFLASLTIDENRIQRDYLPYAAPTMYAQPVLDRVGATGSAVAVWEAVLSVFRMRMRARGPLPTGALPVVLQRRYGLSELPVETQRTLAARTVTMREIETAIITALTVPGGYEPVPRMPRTSRLEVKMDVGGCSDNAIERALSLRMDYQDYWRDRESGDPTARAERKQLERLLHRLSDRATESAQPQGAILWRQIQSEIDGIEQAELPTGIDTEMALGGVCDLASQCKVWFGPRFDIDAVIASRRTALEAEA